MKSSSNPIAWVLPSPTLESSSSRDEWPEMAREASKWPRNGRGGGQKWFGRLLDCHMAPETRNRTSLLRPSKSSENLQSKYKGHLNLCWIRPEIRQDEGDAYVVKSTALGPVNTAAAALSEVALRSPKEEPVKLGSCTISRHNPSLNHRPT